MNKNYLTRAGIALAILLLCLKLWASIATKSMAVLSDALNSFLDIFSYSAIHISVRFNDMQADKNHPYGHHRAEPIAGFIIAILAAILGGSIIKDSFLGIFQSHVVLRNKIATVIMIFAIASKIIIAIFYRISAKKYNSPALDASYVDSRNDVLASSIAILGMLVGGYYDHIAGLLIGIWIIYSGASLGYKNLKYLMGHTPPKEIIAAITKESMQIPGVIGFNDLRAHYVGDVIHVELHIEVDDKLSIRDAHDIGIIVRDRLEALTPIQKAFIHIDPISDIKN
jgi:cation diffusion facilitator family transporter